MELLCDDWGAEDDDEWAGRGFSIKPPEHVL